MTEHRQPVSNGNILLSYESDRAVEVEPLGKYSQAIECLFVTDDRDANFGQLKDSEVKQEIARKIREMQQQNQERESLAKQARFIYSSYESFVYFLIAEKTVELLGIEESDIATFAQWSLGRLEIAEFRGSDAVDVEIIDMVAVALDGYYQLKLNEAVWRSVTV